MMSEELIQLFAQYMKQPIGTIRACVAVHNKTLTKFAAEKQFGLTAYSMAFQLRKYKRLLDFIARANELQVSREELRK